jgi:predicted O-linked N-acetylglucosamine transferase (SPINDLY family)
MADAGARAFKRARLKKEQKKAVDELLAAAVECYSGQRFAEAQFICNQVLTFQPQNFDALSLLGISQIDSGDKEIAEATLKQALAIEPRSAEAHCNYGVALFELKRFDEARVAYERAVELKPRYSMALNNLGNAWKHLGQAEKALEFYDKAIEIDRAYADAWANSGSVHLMRSRFIEAERCLTEALRLNPRSVEALCNMCRLHMLCRNYTAARVRIEMALALRPDFPDALIQRGWLQLAFGKLEAAYQTCEAALALAPSAPLIMFAGAETARMAGHSARAAELAEQILDKTPKDEAALSLLGSCMAAWGDALGALSKYDEAIAIAPNYEAAIANKIFVLDFLPDADFAMHQDARRWWWDHVGQYLPRCVLDPVDLDPDRRIRIGYVSSDFRSHSVAFSVLPVFRAHDHAKFAIVAYHCSLENDNVTEEVRALVDEWVDVAELSDEALAQRIMADRIDILVDLSGYTAGNRIAVFARKPALIQASAWGHPTGTGIPLIDYLLADPVTIPQEVRAIHAEQIADLPCVITVSPVELPVSPLPMQTKGYVTFGVFNRIEKISDEAIALWGRIFAALPDARLVVKHSMVDDPELRTALLERFVARGITAERVTWLGRTPREGHLLAFADVDISLDPFPQNGGVSTWESLYMGVPVITKLGKTVSGRVAGAIVTSIGLTQFVASNEDDYVAIALRWASNADDLAVLRHQMRERIANSDSGDTVRYCRKVEALYRRFWQDYCASSRTKTTDAPS